MPSTEDEEMEGSSANRKMIGMWFDPSLFNLIGLYAAYTNQTKSGLAKGLITKLLQDEEEKGITMNKMIRELARRAMLPWNKNIRFSKFRREIMYGLQRKNVDEEIVNYILAEVDRIHAEKTRGFVR